MKKYIICLLLLLLTGCSSAVDIKEQEAKEIVCKDAGIQIEEATFTKNKYSKEDHEYEFEFHTDTYSYEYEVNARDGAIKSRESKLIRNATNENNTNSNPNSNQSTYSKEQILQAALQHFALENVEVRNLKIEKDIKDNGMKVFEVSFHYDTYEYDCDLKQDTLEVVDFSKEYEGY